MKVHQFNGRRGSHENKALCGAADWRYTGSSSRATRTVDCVKCLHVLDALARNFGVKERNDR